MVLIWIILNPKTWKGFENLTDEMVLNIMPASKHLIKGVGYILCAAALWAYANEPDLLPSTLKKRIQKFFPLNSKLAKVAPIGIPIRLANKRAVRLTFKDRNIIE